MHLLFINLKIEAYFKIPVSLIKPLFLNSFVHIY